MVYRRISCVKCSKACGYKTIPGLGIDIEVEFKDKNNSSGFYRVARQGKVKCA
jgi:hypothetical protein